MKKDRSVDKQSSLVFCIVLLVPFGCVPLHNCLSRKKTPDEFLSFLSYIGFSAVMLCTYV
jgi:hypothetical protein